MVFSSAIFLLLFLPITFILNYFIPNKYSNLLLLVASLIFYAWGEPIYVLLMLASIVINWVIGRMIDRLSGKKRGLALFVGVVCDLGILGYYKYAAFFVSMIASVIALPVSGSDEFDPNRGYQSSGSYCVQKIMEPPTLLDSIISRRS